MMSNKPAVEKITPFDTAFCRVSSFAAADVQMAFGQLGTDCHAPLSRSVGLRRSSSHAA